MNRHIRRSSHGRNYLIVKKRPEAIHLGRDDELLFEDRCRLLYVAVVNRHDEVTGPQRLGALTNQCVQAGVGLFQGYQDVHRIELFVSEILNDSVELVEADGRLPGRRATGECGPQLILDVVERRAILAAALDVRKCLGQLFERTIGACLIGPGYDERWFLAVCLRDDLDDPFSRL